jgi:hypothetical protein
MRRFSQFGNKHPQKKCNHSIDTFAMSGDTALRDFFVNYEHMAHSSLFPKEHVANCCVIVTHLNQVFHSPSQIVPGTSRKLTDVDRNRAAAPSLDSFDLHQIEVVSVRS